MNQSKHKTEIYIEIYHIGGPMQPTWQSRIQVSWKNVSINVMLGISYNLSYMNKNIDIKVLSATFSFVTGMDDSLRFSFFLLEWHVCVQSKFFAKII